MTCLRTYRLSSPNLRIWVMRRHQATHTAAFLFPVSMRPIDASRGGANGVGQRVQPSKHSWALASTGYGVAHPESPHSMHG